MGGVRVWHVRLLYQNSAANLNSGSLFTKVCARYRVALFQQLSKGTIYMYLALYPSTHVPASVSGNKSLPV